MQDAIRELITTLEEAWQRQDWQALEHCYHADVVLMPPDAGAPIRGRDAVLDTYRDFSRMARLERFAERGLEIFEFGSTRIAQLSFEVDYELDGERFRDEGLEIYVLAATDDQQPVVVWRQQQLLNQQRLA